jgi:hypothetical protein
MIETHAQTRDRHEPGRYELRVKGHLETRWVTWFDGLSLTREADGTTVIRGQIADQAALHGLIQKVRDAGLHLVSISCVEPDRPAPTSILDSPPNHQEGDRHD